MQQNLNTTHREVRGTGAIGTIVTVSGSRARILLDKCFHIDPSAKAPNPYIGTVLTVDTGPTIVLCLITAMSVPNSSVDKELIDPRIADVELVGELPRDQEGNLCAFRRGVSIYPRLSERVHPANREILEKAYSFQDLDAVEVGVIHQDPTIPAVIKVNEMLGKHFAIVGSTGTGKSCTVALVLRQVLSKHPNAHILLLDPHNEYAECFGTAAEIAQVSNLTLPFWILNFEEIVETLIGDATKHTEEVDILRDLIPIAKRQFAKNSRRAAGDATQQTSMVHERFSVDVPTPYRTSDLVALLDAQMGRLEMQKELGPYKRLKARIESITQDPRYSFMFGSLTVHDNLSKVLKRLFRVPVNNKPVTVVQLMGLPTEIVNVVVSVLARLAFDVAMWSGGKIPITFVCEEAHRYVPRFTDVGFEPTKRAISRIAKEGRKYGASLCVVSQRPGDIDPTILSQCSTLFAMRLSNERDQNIVQSALSDATASLLNFLPSLGSRETIVFGEGVTLPSRIRLFQLPIEALPRGNSAKFAEAWSNDLGADGMIEEIVARWRTVGQARGENEGLTAPAPKSVGENRHMEGMTASPFHKSEVVGTPPLFDKSKVHSAVTPASSSIEYPKG